MTDAPLVNAALADRSPGLTAETLIATHGGVVGGATLWRLLGFRSADAFRKAAQRRTLPVNVFTLPHRRGRFAKTADVAVWLASLTPQTSLGKEDR